MTACWKIGRDLAEGNECVAFLIGLAVNPGLQTALDVHGGGGRVDPAQGDERERGQRPEKRDRDEEPANKKQDRKFMGNGKSAFGTGAWGISSGIRGHILRIIGRGEESG